AMKAALALPDVVDKTIKFAKQKGGKADREHLYRATGFLPTPSGGISIINQVAANAQARNAGMGDGSGGMFVPFEKDVIDLDTKEAGPAPLPSGESNRVQQESD